LNQSLKVFQGPAKTELRGAARPAVRKVLSGGLTHQGGVGDHVSNVIGDLIGLA
jgi:hypothetical protein